TFSLVVALVQGDEERRILALELPGEAHRHLVRGLRERGLRRCDGRQEGKPCACDDQPPRCSSHASPLTVPVGCCCRGKAPCYVVASPSPQGSAGAASAPFVPALRCSDRGGVLR